MNVLHLILVRHRNILATRFKINRIVLTKRFFSHCEIQKKFLDIAIIVLQEQVKYHNFKVLTRVTIRFNPCNTNISLGSKNNNAESITQSRSVCEFMMYIESHLECNHCPDLIFMNYKALCFKSVS